jgi:hypothetical protein
MPRRRDRRKLDAGNDGVADRADAFDGHLHGVARL